MSSPWSFRTCAQRRFPRLAAGPGQVGPAARGARAMRIEDGPMLLRSTVLVLVAAAVVSDGCAIVNKMSGVSEARAIQKVGEPAQATVLQVWDTGVTVNDDPVIGLRVRVERAGQSPYEAVIKKSLVSRVHIPQFQPGSRVPVKVDPKDPNRLALDVYKYD